MGGWIDLHYEFRDCSTSYSNFSGHSGYESTLLFFNPLVYYFVSFVFELVGWTLESSFACVAEWLTFVSP